MLGFILLIIFFKKEDLTRKVIFRIRFLVEFGKKSYLRLMKKSEAQLHIKEVLSSCKNKYSPESITVYQYWAKVIRVVDGDTLELELELGFDLKIRNMLRLIGINSPETYGVKKDSTEYQKGIKAKEYVESFVQINEWVEVEVYSGKKEKYGRWLGQIYKNGESLNVKLLTEELAVAY